MEDKQKHEKCYKWKQIESERGKERERATALKQIGNNFFDEKHFEFYFRLSGHFSNAIPIVFFSAA